MEMNETEKINKIKVGSFKREKDKSLAGLTKANRKT